MKTFKYMLRVMSRLWIILPHHKIIGMFHRADYYLRENNPHKRNLYKDFQNWFYHVLIYGSLIRFAWYGLTSHVILQVFAIGITVWLVIDLARSISDSVFGRG